MIKKFLLFIYIILSALLIFYLALPSPGFPRPPEGSFRSIEPGDNETPLRQAYYTDLSREEVISIYKKQFEEPTFKNIPFFTERLNYPPEEAQTLIRDQTKSSFLEELVHPFRESIYINGFEPKDDRYKLIADSRQWKLKITVRYVPSDMKLRIFVGIITLLVSFILIKEYRNLTKK